MSDSDYLGDSDDDYTFSDNDEADFYSNNSSAKGKRKETACNLVFKALSPKDLQDMIDDDIRQLAGILPFEVQTFVIQSYQNSDPERRDVLTYKPPVVSILLRHFRWNKERLLEKYTENALEVFDSAGESYEQPASPVQPPSKRARLGLLQPPSNFICGICFDASDSDQTFQLRCQHRFCTECWKAYLDGKIREEGQCTIECMEDRCRTVVDEPSILKIVETSCYERYRKLLQESYVAVNPSLRFCPHPSCSQIILCQGVTESTLSTLVPTVSCGAPHTFCFGCGMDSDHKPLICKVAKMWLKSAREDAGTSQWIKANTRTCPKCQQSIEKAGGCNRMMCRHCNYQFCWMCMRKWEVHGYNDSVCSTWKDPDPDDTMTEARRSLDKWLFYFDRFNNHELSANLDQELCERTAEKMVEIQESSNLSWIETKFMEQAVAELTKCRMTLKWTYAMAHFLATGNNKQIFEDLQADLEKAVEDLSQLLEEPIEAETVRQLRQRMIDKTVYVQKRHEIVRQDTANGLAEGRWEWTVSLN